MKKFTVWSALALLVVATACEKKSPVAASATTASGSGAVVVDAATGVTLTTPTPVSPANNADIKNVDQPVTLTVKNAITTSSSPLTYSFEVASDSGFGTKVYSKDGVAQGSGQTSLTIDRLTPNKTYYWRSHAVVNGNPGLNSAVLSFKVGPEVILQAPVLADPGSNATVSDTPTLTVNNVQRSGPAGPIFYRFEVSDSSAFSSLVTVVAGVLETSNGAGVTSVTLTTKLNEQTYWWRVQASDPSNKVTSPYSVPNPFKVQKGINLNTAIIVLGPTNIGSWEQTATVTDAYFADGQLCIYHTRLGIWPGTQYFDTDVQVEGNQWVFMNSNGQWYGGAADWYKPGQACKAVDAGSIGRDAFYMPGQEPLHSWVPQSGEIFGLMATTPARLWPQMRTYDERSNVVLVRWP